MMLVKALNKQTLIEEKVKKISSENVEKQEECFECKNAIKIRD